MQFSFWWNGFKSQISGLIKYLVNSFHLLLYTLVRHLPWEFGNQLHAMCVLGNICDMCQDAYVQSMMAVEDLSVLTYDDIKWKFQKVSICF